MCHDHQKILSGAPIVKGFTSALSGTLDNKSAVRHALRQGAIFEIFRKKQ